MAGFSHLVVVVHPWMWTIFAFELDVLYANLIKRVSYASNSFVSFIIIYPELFCNALVYYFEIY